jgi:hypothetical protein
MKGIIMKYGILAVFMFAASFNVALGAEQAVQDTKAVAEQTSDKIQIPSKDSSEYWNVRSEAISELLPLLTKKRTDMKKNVQLIEDYLLQIDKASDFAGKNIPVPSDPNVYFEILQISQILPGLDTSKITKRPTWDELMELVMTHVLIEGYLPTDVEVSELPQYIQICKKKEEYGQKVRQDMRIALDQCAKMWVYLDSINQKAVFKAYYVDLQLQQKAQKDAMQASITEEHQSQVRSRSADKEQQQYDNKMAQAQFKSSQKERRYESRDQQQLYRQSRLDERMVNSGGYH